jgi:cell shape-determining protein MreD
VFSKNLILFLTFYILILFQTSFLIVFAVKGRVPNLVLFFLFWLTFFISSLKRKDSILTGVSWETFFAGFFLDIFSAHFIGFSVLILFLNVFLIEKVLKNLEKHNFFTFAFFLLIFQTLYAFFLSLVDYFPGKLNFSFFFELLSAQLILNLPLAVISFVLFRILKRRKLIA